VTYFVTVRQTGPDWKLGAALEEQSGWTEHAQFMDALVDAGFVYLGGPLEVAGRRVVLIVEAASDAEVRYTLARDPWSGTHLVVESVDAWEIRLDGRPGDRFPPRPAVDRADSPGA
jgi:hypothetical protein